MFGNVFFSAGMTLTFIKQTAKEIQFQIFSAQMFHPLSFQLKHK